ncbi:hypothetical protein ACLESO_11925 [Pyxidicoccus sp. 3LG]
MRLPTSCLTRMGPALALFLLLPAAHAAEVSPASQVDTSPGLTPEAVKRAFDQQRQTLVSCMRLLANGYGREDTPWNPGEVDDRILLTFLIGRDGKVEGDIDRVHFRVEGLYLDPKCAELVVNSWTFPAFPGREDETVRVSIRARFSTTAAERKAALARNQKELDALCQTLSALDEGKPPTREATAKAIQRFLGERRSSVSPRLVYFVRALPDFDAEDLVVVFENAHVELVGVRPTCPKVLGWRQREP